MPLTFGKAIPLWVKRAARKAYHQQVLDDEGWNIHVEFATKKALGWSPRKQIWGLTTYFSEYKSAIIRLYRGIKQDEAGLDVIRHEFRHCGGYGRLSFLMDEVARLKVKARPSISRALGLVVRTFNRELEQAIETDIRIFKRLRKRL